jgi:hypothetical protein
MTEGVLHRHGPQGLDRPLGVLNLLGSARKSLMYESRGRYMTARAAKAAAGARSRKSTVRRLA